MTSRFLGNIIFTKEEILSLSKVRIIKKNLVHVHGLPQNFANVEKLKMPEYFGQYGIIQKIILSKKKNKETNKTTFSVYITYSNEKEAATAILSVDSLLIEGKIIRAFFGTTKYCNYFLNNIPCSNKNKCIFLHQLIKDKDITIDSNTVFSYNEHLALAKKIIDFSNPETRCILQNMPKYNNTIFPNIDFIFLDEKEKEKYFHSSNIFYIKGETENDGNMNQKESKDSNYFEDNNNNKNNPNLLRKKLIINNSVNNSKEPNGFFIGNNPIKNLETNTENNIDLINSPVNKDKKSNNNNNNINPDDPLFLHNLFKNTIKHILLVKPFFIKLEKYIPLQKMEFDFFKKELNKNGNNINILLDGCLDCIVNKDQK